MRAPQLSPSLKTSRSTPAQPHLPAKTAPGPKATLLRSEHPASAAAVLPHGLFIQPPSQREPITLGSPHHPAEQRAEALSRAIPSPSSALPRRPPAPEPALTLSPGESGFALPEPQRRALEPRFHFDFANIRIHTTPSAEHAAQAVGARAFSLGSHLVFAPGQYAPHTPPGRALLAHELAHVVDRQSLPNQSPNQAPVLRRQLAPGAPVAAPPVPATPRTDPPTLDPGTLDLLDLVGQLLSPGRSVFKIAMDLSLVPLAARLAWELVHTGLFGPVMQEATTAGLLPAVDLDFSQRTALQVRWFFDRHQPAAAFFYLNGLSMIDMIDVLRLLPPAKLQEVADTFAPGAQQTVALEKDYSAPGLARFHTALAAVQGKPADAADAASVPEDQQQAAQGFRDQQNWLTLLPRANRNKKQKQGITPNQDPKTSAAQPMLLPGGYTTRPGTAPPAEAEAVVEIIRRNRQRLTDRISSRERSPTGFSHGGSLSKDARPSTLPALGTPNKSRPQQVDEAMFAELGGEGSSASVNTYDTALLTLGKGLANGPALTNFVLKLFATDPAFKAAFSAAGVTLAPDPLAPDTPAPAKPAKGRAAPSPEAKWFAVNTQQGVVEEGDQALQLIRLDPRIQSIYIELAESDTHRQQVADAQWSTIKNLPAFRFSPKVRDTWPLETIRGCAHFIHWGNGAQWSDFENNASLQANPTYKTALRAMVEHLIAHTGYVAEISPKDNIRMVKFQGKDKTNPSTTMMNFADSFAMTQGIVVPVPTNDQPNSIYFDRFDADSIPADKPKKYLKLV